MPTCRRKRVVLTEPSGALLDAVQTDPSKHVFYLHQTGEIFETYEAYAARMSFYRLKQFQCEVTGKSGLDYFQAVESERQEARTLHARFSEPLKPAVLKAVQWQVMGRLDHLVEAVYERFKDRYFPGEKILVDLSGVKYIAQVEKVYPPKYTYSAEARDALMNAPSSSTQDEEPPHVIGGDLNIPTKEALESDNPGLYFYWVHLNELERDKSHEKGKPSTKITENDKRLVGSLIEVQCGMMSRDRLSFSKSILRRFIRDCVDRDAAVASPWTVKPPIAKRFGVDSIMPEETRQGVENIKKGEIDKRKKIWEDKEGPPTKKHKKMTPAQEDRAEKREREAREKAEKQRLAKEEADRIAAEKKKKKPVRYPTEDLDIRLSEKDKKAGMRLTRPLPNQSLLPFNDAPGTFESFLMAWNFLVVYGQPLHLSTFTLDEFENGLRHTLADMPCALLAEIHSALIYNLRTVSFTRHSATLSLLEHKDLLAKQHREDEGVLGVQMDELVAAMADYGNNWERVALRHSEGREGWEDALVGCLKDHANLVNFPKLQGVLTRWLFSSEPSESKTASPMDGVEPPSRDVASPDEGYYNLSPEDRIEILSFMCNLAISSKTIHTHMESCEEQLTALRKEKIEVNRQKKQLQEEIGVLVGDQKEETPSAASGNGEDAMQVDSSELSDDASEVTSESASAAGKKSSRQKDLRLKAHTIAHSKEREAARAKQASQKQAQTEQRRLEEEVAKVDRRLEGIERDFRKLLGGVRVKPIGRDRFYNRIWWFDGMGSASLIGSGGIALYGTGRIFIQGPSEFDLQQLEKKAVEDAEDIDARRREEEGPECMLGPQDWAVYTELEELEAFVSWLNPKGHRELSLKSTFTKWWPHITSGMRKRIADINSNAKIPDARRSSRKTALGSDLAREPYMLWTNRRAVNASWIERGRAVDYDKLLVRSAQRKFALMTICRDVPCQKFKLQAITHTHINAPFILPLDDLGPGFLQTMLSSSSFNFGSASSARSSVRDAIESYRRAQYLVAGSTLAATSDDSVFDDDDEEALHALQDEDIEEEEEEREIGGIDVPNRAREDSFTGLQWDEDYDSLQSSPAAPSVLRPFGRRPQPNRSQTITQGSYGIARTPTSYLEVPAGPPIIVRRPSEDTPLLKKTVSFSTLAQPQRPSDVSSPSKGAEPIAEGSVSGPLRRRLSSASAMSGVKHHRGGQSTYGQTLFNSIAILLGIGMLSEPLAFAYSGWTIGTFLIIAYGYVACYTAKILARVILSDSRLRSYSDIGKKAFGPKVMPFISVMFCLELFAVSVVLITLYGDSLHSLIPTVSPNSFKVWGLIVLIPTVFLPLSLLSYTSILGIISTISMVLVIFIDGFSKKEAPGSLFSPAPTEFVVTNVKELGMAFGLFMAGFSGHAVIPSIARDMADPTQFESMIDWAFLVATVIYTAIGYAGYIMFGRDVSDEISIDLLRTPGYNPLLNQLCLWMLVLSPLSKFALNTQPLNATLEILLGIDMPISSPKALVDKPDGLSAVPAGSHFSWKRAFGILQRVLLTSFAVLVSILVPEFSAVMAIIGAFSAFVLSIVGPVYAKYMIEGECTAFDKIIMAVGIVMAIWGTFAALTT